MYLVKFYLCVFPKPWINNLCDCFNSVILWEFGFTEQLIGCKIPFFSLIGTLCPFCEVWGDIVLLSSHWFDFFSRRLYLSVFKSVGILVVFLKWTMMWRPILLPVPVKFVLKSSFPGAIMRHRDTWGALWNLHVLSLLLFAWRCWLTTGIPSCPWSSTSLPLAKTSSPPAAFKMAHLSANRFRWWQTERNSEAVRGSLRQRRWFRMQVQCDACEAACLRVGWVRRRIFVVSLDVWYWLFFFLPISPLSETKVNRYPIPIDAVVELTH